MDSRDLMRRCWLSSKDEVAATLSQELRRLMQAADAGTSAREAARRLAVSDSAVAKLGRRVRETGKSTRSGLAATANCC